MHCFPALLVGLKNDEPMFTEVCILIRGTKICQNEINGGYFSQLGYRPPFWKIKIDNDLNLSRFAVSFKRFPPIFIPVID